MEKIFEHNCVGLCIQETCDNEQEYFINILVDNMNIILGFCRYHSEIFDEGFWNRTSNKYRLGGTAFFDSEIKRAVLKNE